MSLPVELRLQIAAYALEQSASDIFLPQPKAYQRIKPEYDATSNLSILLVCRQFYQDFAKIAFQMTTFILGHNDSTGEVEHCPAQLCEALSTKVSTLWNLRKVVLELSVCQSVLEWRNYPFNNEHIHLDELSVIATVDCDADFIRYVPWLLRRLQHVRKIRILPVAVRSLLYRQSYGNLLGLIYKKDHYDRYDAPNAPDFGATWFEPSYNDEDTSYDFVAREPEPMIAEEEYMVMMKPKIDHLMDWMSKIS